MRNEQRRRGRGREEEEVDDGQKEDNRKSERIGK